MEKVPFRTQLLMETMVASIRAFLSTERCTYRHPDLGIYTESRALLETLIERGGGE